MDFFFPLLVITVILLWGYMLSSASNSRRRNSAKLPPGPKPFPIIGNILELCQKPHQSLTKLSKTYGPLMSLKLGCRTAVVVSSPEIAKLVLQKYDQAFCGRSVPAAAHALDHDKLSMVWIPASSQWRNLRKISKEHMFSQQILDQSQGLRQEKLQKLLEYVNECCVNNQAVNIGSVAFTTSLNLLSATLFSVNFADFGSDSSQELREIIWGIMECVGGPNVADFFPILGFVDPQGIFRLTKVYFGRIFEIFDDIIDRRLESKTSSLEPERKNDVLEALLDLNERDEPGLTRNDMKHLLLDLFVAGTDTTSSTVEWAMAELLRNPEKMMKIKFELREGIGQNGQVEEADISRLPYLQAVVKETFRLHPAAPLLVPHKAEADVEINGYIVPENAQILVNVWACGKDSSIWSKPELFEPERFLDSKIDIKGQDFELIPFGGGRRICPGLPLAYRMVHLVVASLVHNFDWSLEEGMKTEEMDMSEKFGITLQKAVPVKAVPVKVS